MRAFGTLATTLVGLFAVLPASRGAEGAKTFYVFSLKAAESRVRESGGRPASAVADLGQITRLVGLVVDPVTRDCVVIGERDSSLRPIYLDDLVVMLRSVFLHQDKEAPGVTIDPNEKDPRRGDQQVRYFGHIEGTRVGLVCFEADHLMKRIGLGLQPSRVEGVRVYFDLAVEESMKGGRQNTEVMSRFWYYPIVARVVSVGNGVLLDRCELTVLTEVLAARVNGQPVKNPERFYDKPSEVFARSFSDHFDELAGAWAAIQDLSSLSALAALSRGLAKTDARPDLRYWLDEYQVPHVATPSKVPVLRNVAAEARLEVCGGVHLHALSIRLKEGDLTAFTEAVLRARPSAQALTWSVVLTPDKDLIVPGMAGPMEAASAAEAFARGDHLLRAKEYDLAIACWRQVARTYPQMGEAYYWIGGAFERKGLLACAADYYTKAIELDPFLKNVSRPSGSGNHPFGKEAMR